MGETLPEGEGCPVLFVKFSLIFWLSTGGGYNKLFLKDTNKTTKEKTGLFLIFKSVSYKDDMYCCPDKNVSLSRQNVSLSRQGVFLSRQVCIAVPTRLDVSLSRQLVALFGH